MELKLEVKWKRRALPHAPQPEMTLKSATPCVKPTSRSSTARPQEKIPPDQGGAFAPSPTDFSPRDARSIPHGREKQEVVARESMPALGLFHRRELLCA